MKKRALLNILHKKGVKLNSSFTTAHTTPTSSNNNNFYILNESYKELSNEENIPNNHSSQKTEHNDVTTPRFTFTAPSSHGSPSKSEVSTPGGNHGNHEVHAQMHDQKRETLDDTIDRIFDDGDDDGDKEEENPDTIVADAFQYVDEIENESSLQSSQDIQTEKNNIDDHIHEIESFQETRLRAGQSSSQMTTKTNPLYEQTEPHEDLFPTSMSPQKQTNNTHSEIKFRPAISMDYSRGNGAFIVPNTVDNSFYKHWSPTNATSYLDNEIMSIRSMMSRKTNKRFYSNKSDKTPTWVYTLFGILIWTFILHCINAVEGRKILSECSSSDHLRYWLCYFSVAFVMSFAEMCFEKRERQDILLLIPFNLLILAVIHEAPLICAFESSRTLYWVNAGLTFLIAVFVVMFWAIKKKSNK